MSDKADSNTLEPGARFGRYKVVRVIGTGGMGAVYEALHTDLNKKVALKIIHRELAMREEIATRFMREGAAASKIRHAHVVDVTDFGVQDGVPYLVMEYLEGESMSAVVKRGEVPIAMAVDIMLPVCAAIATAHEASVIHRDLKPDNIFLTRSRSGEYFPKVVDFGISKITDAADNVDLTSTGSMLGTPSYMSPEQLRTSKYADARSDEYSMGVILYEALTQRKPFTGGTLYELMHQIVHGECVPPREIRPEIPAELEAVVLRAMNITPAARFDTVRTFACALLPFASDRARVVWAEEFAGAVDSSPTPAPSNTPRSFPPNASAMPTPGTLATSAREIDARPTAAPSRSSRVWIGAAAAIVVVAAGVSYKVTRPGTEPLHDGAASGASAAVAPPTTTMRAETYLARVTVQPLTAQIDVDGQPMGTGSFERTFDRDGASHQMRIHAPGFQTQLISFRDAAPPANVVLDEATVAVAPPVAPAATPNDSRDRHASSASHARHPGASASSTSSSANPAHAEPEAHSAVGTNGAAILN